MPVTAVQTNQDGQYVLIVGPDNKVAQADRDGGAQIAQKRPSPGLKAGGAGDHRRHSEGEGG